MTNLPREPRGANLTPRTRTIHNILLALTDSTGLIEATLDELASECGITRHALGPHLARLRCAGLLVNLETIGQGGKRWRRLRRVLPELCNPYQTTLPNSPDPYQTTLPNSPLYLSSSYVSPSVELRSTYRETTRLRRGQDLMDDQLDVNGELDALLNADDDARAFDLHDLPAYPSTKLFPPAKVPRMPRTSGDPYSDAMLLIKAWKCGVLKVYGKTPQLRPKKPATFRMKAVAPLVHKLKITPHAWVRFRITQCRHAHPDSKKHPTIDMAWSRKGLEKNLDFYESQSASLDPLGKVQLTPSHQKLLDKWELLRLEVASPKHPPGGVATRVIVDRLLPPTEYRRLTDMIETERRQIEAELYRRGASGEWIW